ncbi:chromatin structure-remodeling complex subunit RSC7 [Thecaphora frezii]
MPGPRAITLRVRKPQQLQSQARSSDPANPEDQAPASGSSLTSIDAAAAEPSAKAHKLERGDDDMTMTDDAEAPADEPPASQSQPARPASSRIRRTRLSRTRSTDQSVEAMAEAVASPRSSRRRRQSTMHIPKEEEEEEEGETAKAEASNTQKGAVDTTDAHADEHLLIEEAEGAAEQVAASDPVYADAEDAGNADEDDDEDGDQDANEEVDLDDKDAGADAEASQRPTRGSARARAKAGAQAKARARGRASVSRGKSKATPSRTRGKSRSAPASDDETNQSGVEDAENGDDAAEDDNVEDAGSGDDNEGTGIDAEGYKTITIKGKVYRLDGDEVMLDSDPDGDKKIDAKGRLQGGRQYKAYNFTSELRDDPDRVYMLSIDAARAAGYRDSLYFFRRNPMIIKITLHQGEKDKLIEDGRLSGQLKSRNVTMVAARNVYKLHGAKFLSGGKAVIDDYFEAAARASGAKEGKTVGGMSMEEQERKKEADRDRDRSRRRPDAFTFTTYDPQGEAVVTVFGDGGQTPFVRAGNWVSRKTFLQRAEITEENWMLEMARSVRGMNSELAETRRERLVAFPRFEEGPTAADSATEVLDGEADPEEDEEAENDRPPWEREASPCEGVEASLKRRAAAAARLEARKRRGPPIGIYEPYTHMPHFNLNTQPTWAKLEKISPRPHFVRDGARDEGSTRPLLGGDRVGSGAWGVASFSTEVVAPPPPDAAVWIAGGVDADS